MKVDLIVLIRIGAKNFIITDKDKKFYMDLEAKQQLEREIKEFNKKTERTNCSKRNESHHKRQPNIGSRNPRLPWKGN